MYQRALPTPSGSGGGYLYTKSGTIPAFSLGQTQTVDTGLSTVKYFYYYANNTTNANLWCTTLDMDRPLNKQLACFSASTGALANGGSKGSGTDSSGLISSGGYGVRITDITNGVVSLQCSSAGAAYVPTNAGVWYAG